MRPRWHKVFSDLLSHKVRSLLVILSVAVGLFAIGMITTSYVILSQDIRSGYQGINPANIQVRAATPFGSDLVNHMRKQPGIAEAEGAWDMTLQIRADLGEWEPISIKAQTQSKTNHKPIAQPTLLEGKWPPADKELVLDVSQIDDIGVVLGDEVEIKLPSGAIRRMPVSGLVKDQTIGSSGAEGGYFLANMQGYVTSDTLPWLEQIDAFNTLYATVTTGHEDLEAIRAIANNLLEEFDKNNYLTTGSVVRSSTQHPNLAYVDAMAAVVFLLGFLVIFLSGFLITNTLSALLKQQVEQIGAMKTIGASRQQIIELYMVLILVFSLIALAISIPLSNQAAYAMLDYLAEKINFRVIEYRHIPASFLLQIVMALIVPQLAGINPILQGTRISVREALSGTNPVKTGKMRKHAPQGMRKINIRISRPILISMRNTLRQRTRLILTLITLSLSGAIFISTFNMRNSIESYIDRLGRYFMADVNLTLDYAYRIDLVENDLMQVPGVETVEGWGYALASVVTEEGKAGESVQLISPPVGSVLIEPMLEEGRWIQPGDQNAIVLNELFKEIYPQFGIGDSIQLKIGLKESDWVVVGFFQFAGKSSGLMAYTNYEYLAREIGMLGKSATFRVNSNGETLNIDQQKALAQQVEAHMTGLGYQIGDVRPGLTIKEMTSEGLNILTTFLLIMSFLLASVGSIGLAGTMSLNVMERTREIGVMRAIGGSNKAIINIVLVEGISIGLISWLLSGFLALPISKQLSDVIFQIIFDRNATLEITLTGNLIWLGLVVLLSILSSVLPAYNASRLTIREVLAYE